MILLFPTVNVYPTNVVNFDATQVQDIQFITSSYNDISGFEIFIYKQSNGSVSFDTGQVNTIIQDDNYVYHYSLPANKLVNGINYSIAVQAWNTDTPTRVGGLSNKVAFSCIAKPIASISPSGAYPFSSLSCNFNLTGDTPIGVRITVTDSGNIVGDSGIFNPNGLANVYTFSSLVLQTGHTYNLQVSINSSSGLTATANSIINCNYSSYPPPMPVLSLTSDNTIGTVTCTITNPNSDSIHAPIAYDQVFRMNDEGEWVCIANHIVPNSTVNFIDNNMNVGKALQYYIAGVADNGLSTSSDIQTTTVNAPIIAQIYPIDNVGQGLIIKYDLECTETIGRLKVINQFNGREKPIADIGDNINRKFSIKFTCLFSWEVIIARQLAMSTAILFYRDKKGRGLFCTIDEDSLQIQNKSPRIYSISFNITEVDYNKG